ncbi:Modifier of mdg4 [Operophtera brumata]|uniref:Modifier of mdg4 n=1 Tax=Operophtera brumata TaxID=104452 RepID=A0A0L7K3Z5_OPEBR|nr:Modifier of mdg4 [Operophtera brumata]
MWRGYTYSEITGKYYCSARQTRVKCKARLKLDAGGNIASVEGEHDHAPPKYIKHSNGEVCSDTVEERKVSSDVARIHVQRDDGELLLHRSNDSGSMQGASQTRCP